MESNIPVNLVRDLEMIQKIPGISEMLELICRATGMGFSAVARVTSEHWLACRVRDEINFGLTEGGELKVETTICSWIRDHKVPVIFNDIKNQDHEVYRSVAAMYGFTSYISYPIIIGNNSFFGTICAIDPKALNVENDLITSLFELFSEWLSFSLQRTSVHNTSFQTKGIETLDNFSRSSLAASQPRIAELVNVLKNLLAG